jgi:hypothetical protein
MKIKISIKNRYTGSIIFEYEKEDNTIKETVLEAIKYGANLSGAYLSRAYLSRAYLSRAYLSRANLSGAKNAEHIIASTRICAEGDIIGYKQANSLDGKVVIVELLIPSMAKRNNAFVRKCRAEYAIVTEIKSIDGNTDFPSAKSSYDSTFKYEIGDTIKPTTPYDENFQNECSSGIHFFITRLEAENY